MNASNPIRQQLVDLTRALIDIPSVSLNEQILTTFVRQHLPQQLPIAYDNGEVLFATTPLRVDKPLVILAGHTDTVPIENNVPSSQEDGVIYGRGACDMKGALAVMLATAQSCAKQPPENFDIGFLFFSREELASDQNMLLPAIADCDALKNAHFAILMEPTANALELGCMGNLNLRVTFKGKAAHSARPWLGRNAAHEMIIAMQQLAITAPNDVNYDGLLFREVASITGIQSGIARNVVAPEATVNLNIRYAPTRQAQEVENEWQEKFLANNTAVEIIGNSPPAPVILHHPIIDKLRMSGATNVTAKQAWTNAADFALHHIPAINFGPGDPQFAHREDEQITSEALWESFQILERFLQ